MDNRINEKNFFNLSRGDYVDQHRESGVALKACEMLEGIGRAIAAAGGIADSKYWAQKSLLEILITAARNNIDISAVYSGPRDAKQGPLIQHTNGYCNSCGDMYVKGYERCHPNCQKDDPPVDMGYTEVPGR